MNVCKWHFVSSSGFNILYTGRYQAKKFFSAEKKATKVILLVNVHINT